MNIMNKSHINHQGVGPNLPASLPKVLPSTDCSTFWEVSLRGPSFVATASRGSSATVPGIFSSIQMLGIWWYLEGSTFTYQLHHMTYIQWKIQDPKMEVLYHMFGHIL
jgi:hypothetical protein